MLSRKFTTREKVLLLILAVLLVGELYYVLIHVRVENDLAEAKARTEAATVTYELETIRAAKKQDMENKIREAENSNARPLPDFNNSTNVVAYLNGVMASTEEYHLVFNAVNFSNYVALRSINMSFSCRDYAAVESIVAQLERGPYYCEVTGLSMSAVHGFRDMMLQNDSIAAEDADVAGGDMTNENVSVQMTVVFYEYAGAVTQQEAE